VEAALPDQLVSDADHVALSRLVVEISWRIDHGQAHACGVKIYAGTLMPFAGSNSVYGGYFGTAYGETLREQVNTWIRTSGAFDGVIDFSTLMQDPCDPQYLNPADNANSASASLGDSLHTNDVGYETMANAVPLTLVR
jgi:lysophospholipase L1-like esterase